MFKKILIVGCGLIGSSILRTSIKKKISKKIYVLEKSKIHIKKIKKLDDRSLMIHHKSLKRKSAVKITNPKNGKSLIAEVKSNNQKFSDFYNSVISRRIAEDLDLDFNEPLLEIVLISRNSTFIAKKSKTFDEEKNVAEKAPIDGIQINDLSKTKKKEKKTASNK